MRNISLKYVPRLKKGYTRIVSPDNAPLRLIEFGVVTLPRGDAVELAANGRELVLTLLKGRGVVEVNGNRCEIGPRKNIFLEHAWAVYVRGGRLRVIARSALEALVASVHVGARARAFERICPSDVTERVVGEGTYERRVRTIVGESFPAHRLLVGETINEAGKWSSYPPHRHEKDSPPKEVRLEEVYYYKLERPNGFGVQRIYTDDGRIDETHTVRDGDLCVLPRGYHPVAAAPSSKLYYFWALAGQKRKMLVRTDPHFE
ncbi:MAG: 5-deoxy-glucuronate isomerase [Candidatus Abyssubacteria bacterium]